MEVRKPHIKSIPYEEWNDNASLEKIIDELHEGAWLAVAHVMTSPVSVSR